MLTIHELYEDIKIGVGAYSSLLSSSVPTYVCEGLLSILWFGAVALILWKGKSTFSYIARLILIEYFFCCIAQLYSSEHQRSIRNLIIGEF